MSFEPRGIDKLIQDAQKEGKFDDLEHKGQPLRVAFGDLASVANDVMRDNGIAPEWIELAREIEKLRQRQSDLIESLAKRRTADRAELEEALAPTTTDDRRPTTDHQLPEGVIADPSNRSHPSHRSDPSDPSPSLVGPSSVVGRRSSVVSLLRRWWSGARSDRSQRADEAPQIATRMERDRRRTLLQVAELVRTERKKVDRYNLVVAIGGRQVRRVNEEERLQQFQERFPVLTLSVGPGAWELHERVEAVDPSLVEILEESASARTARSEEQVAALKHLRAGHRKPPPIG